MGRQFAFVFDDIAGCRVDRFLAGLVDGNPQRFGRERVHVSASADSVLSHKRPGEVRLDAAGGFGDQGDSAGSPSMTPITNSCTEPSFVKDDKQIIVDPIYLNPGNEGWVGVLTDQESGEGKLK